MGSSVPVGSRLVVPDFHFLLTDWSLSVHIRILTSCTKKKAVSCANPITAEDFKRGKEHVASRREELADSTLPAGKMYAGLQHRHLMQGVRTVRRKRSSLNIDVSILSAGYGLVFEEEPIAPYERAFNGKPKAEIRDLADHLDIPRDSRHFVEQSADLVLILLGRKYLHAVDFDETVSFGGNTLLLCSRKAAESLPNWEKVKKILVTREAASRFSEGIVGLKGYLARLLLQKVVRDPGEVEHLMRPQVDVLDALDDHELEAELEL